MNEHETENAVPVMTRPEVRLDAALSELLSYRKEASEAQTQLKLQLRTGLTSILGFAELLHADVAPSGRESVAQVIKAGRELLAFIDGNLDGIPPAEETLSIESSVLPAVNGTNAQGQSVLYVEDNDANFALVRSIMAHVPELTLSRAETGEAALASARRSRPALILLDLDLPDLHGSEVLRRLRADPATADIPVVVLSADETASQIERLLSGGARQYVTKPINIERFLAVIAEVLQLAIQLPH